MEYCFKEFIINSPFPTTSLGHLCQTKLIFQHKDDLKCRIVSFRDQNDWIVHISIDVLAWNLEARDFLLEKMKAFYQNSHIHLIISTTHTHYSHNVLDENYRQFLLNLLLEQLLDLTFQQVGEVLVEYIVENKAIIGRSRISDYESHAEYLGLIRFYHQDQLFLTIICNNCHPTTLAPDSDFFSAEYPGYVLNKMKQLHPETDFTIMIGACGEVSTRFTREDQSYSSMCKLADLLVNEIEVLSKQHGEKKPLTLTYSQRMMTYQFCDADLSFSHLPEHMSQREKQSLQESKGISALQQESNVNPDHQLICSWDLSSVKLVFFPNEIFSCYMNVLDIQKAYLVSYSNGFGEYITPIDFQLITYEKIIDRTTLETKQMIIEQIKSI